MSSKKTPTDMSVPSMKQVAASAKHAAFRATATTGLWYGMQWFTGGSMPPLNASQLESMALTWASVLAADVISNAVHPETYIVSKNKHGVRAVTQMGIEAALTGFIYAELMQLLVVGGGLDITRVTRDVAISELTAGAIAYYFALEDNRASVF